MPMLSILDFINNWKKQKFDICPTYSQIICNVNQNLVRLCSNSPPALPPPAAPHLKQQAT